MSLLVMTSDIVEKCVSICFLTFYILQVGLSKCRGTWGIFPLLSFSTGLGAL